MALGVAAAACQQAPERAPVALARDVFLLDDAAPEPRRQALDGAGAHERVVYVHFDGLAVARGADAPARSTSPVVPRDVVIPPFDATPFSAPPSEVRARIVERVKQHFARFAVKVVWSRPDPAIDYAMCIVGGSPSLLDLPPSVAGIAPLDCDDARGGNVVYAFSEALTPAELGGEARAVAALAAACSHELGHSFGLGHTIDNADLMTTTLSDLTEGFAGPTPVTGGSDPQCVRGAMQDGRGLLARTIGLQIAEDAPAVAFVGVERGRSGVEIRVSAAVPGRFVDAVDLYVDGKRGATLTRPPLRATLGGGDSAGSFVLAAVARDRLDGVAEARVVVPAAVDGSLPSAACRLHADCAATEACVDGRCVDAASTLVAPPAPAPDGGAPRMVADLGTHPAALPPFAGCALAGDTAPSSSGLALVLLAIACAALLVRRRADGGRA